MGSPYPTLPKTPCAQTHPSLLPWQSLPTPHLPPAMSLSQRVFIPHSSTPILMTPLSSRTTVNPYGKIFASKFTEMSTTPQNLVATLSALKTTVINHPTTDICTQGSQPDSHVSSHHEPVLPDSYLGPQWGGSLTPHQLRVKTELRNPALSEDPQMRNIFSTDLIPAPDLRTICRIFPR